MIDPNKSLLIDMNFRTELLESLDWDETQFDSLLKYLQEEIRSNLTSPEELLENIDINYGENARKLVKKMFKEAYIENGLYNKPKGDYEH